MNTDPSLQGTTSDASPRSGRSRGRWTAGGAQGTARPTHFRDDPRAELLHRLARSYVLDGLAKGNFDAIPYAESVVLRAPLCPGGSSVPLNGRENLRVRWWAPLPDLVAGAEVLDTYVNPDLTAVTVEFHCHIRQPACTLRIIDRFTVDDAGQIVAQENFFDPRDVTHPDWRTPARV